MQKHKRSNTRIRESKDYAKFYGFNMKPHFLFGTTILPTKTEEVSFKGGYTAHVPVGNKSEMDWVFTGKTRTVRKPDGTKDHEEIMLFVHYHVSSWESNQTESLCGTWGELWLNADNGFGHKILTKKRGEIVPDVHFKGRAPGSNYKHCRQIGDNVYDRYNQIYGR